MKKKTVNDLINYLSDNEDIKSDDFKWDPPFITGTGGEMSHTDFKNMRKMSSTFHSPVSFMDKKSSHIIGDVFTNELDGLRYMYTNTGLKCLDNESKAM